MTAGANFPIRNGRVYFWETLVTGDDLIVQDHEIRMRQRQLSYAPYPQYGDPFVDTLSDDTISETERDLRLIAEVKECSLQDSRIVDAVVDPSSIETEGIEIKFDYELFKTAGGTVQETFSSTSQVPVDGVVNNFITEDGDNFVDESGNNFVTEPI